MQLIDYASLKCCNLIGQLKGSKFRTMNRNKVCSKAGSVEL